MVTCCAFVPRGCAQVVGFVIAEQNKIYPMMSGHNCICVATALLESGVVAMPPGGGEVKFGLEAPAGAYALPLACDEFRLRSDSFHRTDFPGLRSHAPRPTHQV
jgi:proline racemase